MVRDVRTASSRSRVRTLPGTWMTVDFNKHCTHQHGPRSKVTKMVQNSFTKIGILHCVSKVKPVTPQARELCIQQSRNIVTMYTREFTDASKQEDLPRTFPALPKYAYFSQFLIIMIIIFLLLAVGQFKEI